MLHRERVPDDLRPQLQRLLEAGLVKLHTKTDAEPGFHALNLEEAIEVIREDRNWNAPYDLGEPERREAVYLPVITHTGREALQRESPTPQAS
jgi:hypothetical protein